MAVEANVKNQLKNIIGEYGWEKPNFIAVNPVQART
jgi:hypothetical protein